MRLYLEFHIDTKNESARPWINILIYTIKDLRIKSFILRDCNGVLYCRIEPQEIAYDISEVIPNGDMIYFQEISLLYKMITKCQAGLVEDIQVHSGLMHIPKWLASRG